MSNYQQGYDAGRSHHYEAQQMQRTVSTVGTLLGLVFALGGRLLFWLALASPFLVLGALVAAPFPILGGQLSTGRLLVVGSTGYLAFSALYWLKGVSVSLARRGGRLWLLPLGLCVTVACLVPALLVQRAITHYFPAINLVGSWGLAVAFGLVVYRRYGFTQDSAPTFVSWAYRRGNQWGFNRTSWN